MFLKGKITLDTCMSYLIKPASRALRGQAAQITLWWPRSAQHSPAQPKGNVTDTHTSTGMQAMQ